MSLKSVFGTDKKKEKEGTWITIMTNDDESICRMKVTRAGGSNREFLKQYASIAKKFRGNSQGIPTSAQIDATVAVFVNTILIDWEFVQDIRENPVSTYMPFTKENANLLFKELPDLFDFIVGESTKLENFQTQANEVEAKN